MPVTANSGAIDSPTNTVLLLTTGANGGRLTRLADIPRTAATPLQLYISTDGGATKRMIFAGLMGAYAMAQLKT